MTFWPLKLYLDAECSEPVPEGAYPLAQLHEGEQNVGTFYLKNESRYDVSDITVSDTDSHVIIEISPTRLGPNEVAEVVFNLTAEVTVGMDLSTLNGTMEFRCKVQPKIIPRKVPFDEETD